MIRKFGLDFKDEEELDCFIQDGAVLKIGRAEGDPNPSFMPRYAKPEHNRRVTISFAIGKNSANKRKENESMSDLGHT